LSCDWLALSRPPTRSSVAPAATGVDSVAAKLSLHDPLVFEAGLVSFGNCRASIAMGGSQYFDSSLGQNITTAAPDAIMRLGRPTKARRFSIAPLSRCFVAGVRGRLLSRGSFSGAMPDGE
jgi:hypothetical protein